MTRNLRQFWISCLVTLTIAIALVALAWRSHDRQLPARAPLWLGGDTYLSEYGSHGSPAHYIYRFGLFGLRDRLQASDLLFLGSSHVEYGVSAAQASSELTRVTGQPVRAYNLAVGFGEGIGFATEVIAANDLRDKTVVLDLFSPMGDGGSGYDKVVGRSNTLAAYLKVFDTWLRYADDYVLDPLLPRLSTQTGSKLSEAVVASRLLGVCNTRRWDSGDVVELWTPTLGPVYESPAARIPQPMDQADPERIAGYGEWKLPPATLTTTPATAAPFLPVSAEGLLFFDQVHLTAASRAEVTARLVEDIERAGLIRR
jgi:hypothetical protein